MKPLVSQNLFVYKAPDYKIKYEEAYYEHKPKVHYNLVFIRAPNVDNNPLGPIIVPPPKQKTLVYLLSKKPHGFKQDIIEVPHTPTKPEVFFVNYKDGENPLLPGGIDLHTALKSSQGLKAINLQGSGGYGHGGSGEHGSFGGQGGLGSYGDSGGHEGFHNSEYGEDGGFGGHGGNDLGDFEGTIDSLGDHGDHGDYSGNRGSFELGGGYGSSSVGLSDFGNTGNRGSIYGKEAADYDLRAGQVDDHRTGDVLEGKKSEFIDAFSPTGFASDDYANAAETNARLRSGSSQGSVSPHVTGSLLGSGSTHRLLPSLRTQLPLETESSFGFASQQGAGPLHGSMSSVGPQLPLKSESLFGSVTNHGSTGLRGSLGFQVASGFDEKRIHKSKQALIGD